MSYSQRAKPTSIAPPTEDAEELVGGVTTVTESREAELYQTSTKKPSFFWRIFGGGSSGDTITRVIDTDDRRSKGRVVLAARSAEGTPIKNGYHGGEGTYTRASDQTDTDEEGEEYEETGDRSNGHDEESGMVHESEHTNDNGDTSHQNGPYHGQFDNNGAYPVVDVPRDSRTINNNNTTQLLDEAAIQALALDRISKRIKVNLLLRKYFGTTEEMETIMETAGLVLDYYHKMKYSLAEIDHHNPSDSHSSQDPSAPAILNIHHYRPFYTKGSPLLIYKEKEEEWSHSQTSRNIGTSTCVQTYRATHSTRPLVFTSDVSYIINAAEKTITNCLVLSDKQISAISNLIKNTIKLQWTLQVVMSAQDNSK